MNTIWIVNQYATCPSRGTACRHFMLARELVKQGYEVTIIAGSGHHFHNQHPEKTGQKNSEVIEDVQFVWLKTPQYDQTQQARRGLGWIIFLIRLLLYRCVRKNKPDIIIHSSPSLIPFLGSYILSLRNNSKIVFEFRDVWPLTFVEIGGYSQYHPIVFVQRWIEKFALRKSDACLSSLEFGSQRLEEIGVSTDQFHWLPNGVLYEEFEVALASKTANLGLLDKFVFGYVGTHGKANALLTILYAAKHLQGYPIHIVMTGEGAEREKLLEQAKLLSLDNITFLDNVSKEEVPSVLKSMDGLLISWHDTPLYRYGTSANKLAEYFAAGKPVVQAYNGEGDHVKKYEAGITVPAGDAKAMAQAMIKIATAHKQEIENYSLNGQKAAFENFTFKSLAHRLIKVLGSIPNN